MAPAASRIVDPKIRGPPIAGLPVETITDIFLLLSRSDVRRENLLTLRAVCKRWAEFVDSTPALWTQISTHLGPGLTRRAVESSGSLPLDVDIAVYDRDGLPPAELLLEDMTSASTVLEQLTRIRALDINMEMDPELRQHVAQLLTERSAPKLESFCVLGANLDDGMVTFGDTLLQGAIPPYLMDLALSQCAISLRCPLLQASTLVGLRLDDCRVWKSVEDVLQSLSTWPSLEEFAWTWPDVEEGTWEDDFVDFFVMPEMPTSKWRGKRLTLPHLKTLELRHEAAAIFTTFSRLTLPPSCSIVLEILVNEIGTAAAEDAMFIALDRTLRPHLAAAFGDGGGFTALNIETPREIDALPFESIPGVTASWTLPTTIHAAARFEVTLRRLEELDLCEEQRILREMLNWSQTSSFLTRTSFGRCDFLYEEDVWKSVIRPLETVEHLFISKDEGLISLLEVLHTEPSILPRMSTLYLEECHVDVFADLISAAKWRLYDCSLPPTHITLRQCTIDGGEMVPLMKIDMSP